MSTFNENDLIIYKNGDMTGVAVATIATQIANEIDLIELKDANTGNKLNGDCLIWDSVTQLWINKKLTIEDVTGFNIESSNYDKDILTWDVDSHSWKSTNPEKYINSYSENEIVTGEWTEGEKLYRKVIELDTPLIANIEKTILVDISKGYPVTAILFTKIEGFYRAEDGLYRYSTAGNMKIKLVPNAIEIKLTSTVNHTPHIWIILEYVKPYYPEPTGDRVWTNQFDPSFQNNPS